MLELIARVKSNLRRYVKFGNYKETPDEIEVRGLTLNKKTMLVAVNGQDVRLTALEFKILKLLMENAGVIFSMQQIYESVWNEPFLGSENTVAVHIRRIREKIEVNPREPIYLKGVGHWIQN
jgi:DNA-binding response OmpR family regulator